MNSKWYMSKEFHARYIAYRIDILVEISKGCFKSKRENREIYDNFPVIFPLQNSFPTAHRSDQLPFRKKLCSPINQFAKNNLFSMIHYQRINF